ncbi:hypothetical protein [Mameliella sediminis]|uniref:hypothetical protein n=1 Tax=Mameliella sediminis TaxID=2836866 RepID=UPI001C4516F4|nr:hypothetical protein [Mameliella sediminis]MBV7392878.1 hypothetical protein [Mameliella sediminis]MBY6114641.1 hypothetical protein [Antarctobacter heliothermus]MBY6161494.1 hypothetical protein [Mameliella alba]MCA0954263.1 hypothetical protein [Mameliella alba]
MSMIHLFAAFHAATTCLSAACPASAEPDPWDLIQSIEYEETETETTWSVAKIIPDDLRAMQDGFQITGYYVPVEAQAYVSTFLLVPDPADCPFCGQNGYGPSLEVMMKRPMPDVPEATKITVRGTLNFDDSSETYRAVFVTDGILVD